MLIIYYSCINIVISELMPDSGESGLRETTDFTVPNEPGLASTHPIT